MSPPEFAQARREQAIMMRHGRSFSGHERNCCYLNLGSGKFADISATTGVDLADDGRAVATVDWDHDGDLDLWISNRNAPRLRLLRNDGRFDNRFIALRLVGNGTTTNRNAIGARVEVLVEGAQSEPDSRERPHIKTLRAGEGFLAQSSHWLHFGLDQAQRVRNVIVRWPGGDVEEFGSVPLDQAQELVQGSGKPRAIPRSTAASKLRASPPKPPPPTSQARIPLLTRPRIVPAAMRDLTTNRSRPLPVGEGRPVLLNLWSGSCQPCAVELSEFAKRGRELQDAKIEIVALCVDQIDNSNTRAGAAADLLKQIGFPFLAGHASRQLVSDLQRLHDNFIVMAEPLPLPTSFLVDADGRVSVIYKGPVSVDQLLKDAQRAEGDRVDRYRQAAAIPGRTVDHPQTAKYLRLTETMSGMRLARSWLNSGRFPEAIIAFRDLIALNPDSSQAHYGLGEAYLKQGQLPLAVEQFREAIRWNHRNADAHFRLALALEKLADFAGAVTHYRRGLEIEPSFIEGANNLAWLLATCRDRSLRDATEAIRWAEKCARATDHQNPGVLDSLAAAYAEGGRFADAVRWQNEAIRLTPAAARNRFRARLALYQADKPFRASAPD